MDAARRIELSFQTPLTTSNANQSLDEWNVTPPNVFVSSTTTKSQDQYSQATVEGLLHLRRNKLSVKVLST